MYTIALLGNPNTGKTTVFNLLCNTQQKTGNYPGVTVEKKLGSYVYKTNKIEVVDLPGCYSLNSTALDEQIVKKYLNQEFSGLKKPHLILFILDATNMKRNLYLLSQLLDLNIPIVILLTMVDLLQKNNMSLSLKQFKHRMQIPIIPINARAKKYSNILKKKILMFLEKPPKKLTFNIIKQNTPKYLIPQVRYEWINKITRDIHKTYKNTKVVSFMNKLDNLLTHKILGYFFFIGVIYLIFQAIYTWSLPIMEFIESSVNTLFVLISPYLDTSPLVHSFFENGLFAGIGSVIIFLPQIILLTFFISILEESGYLTRVSFLLDRLFSWIGLNGKSFIPLLSGFACAVPAIMSARVITGYKIRLATITAIPFMSCSARLPVYLLLISAFIQPVYGTNWAVFTLFLMYIIGIIVAIPSMYFLSRGKNSTPFFLEMPVYRLPHFKNVYFQVRTSSLKFLKTAGKIIFIFSIIIWACVYFPHDEKIHNKYNQLISTEKHKTTIDDLKIKQLQNQMNAEYLEKSYLGTVGKWIQPLFAPIGFDWKLTVGVLSAFPAREVIISTLGIIYSIGSDVDETSHALKAKLTVNKNKTGENHYNLITALSLMVFIALCSQCFSTLAIMHKELNSYKWPIFVFFYMTTIAYLVSFVVYKVGNIIYQL